MSAHQNRRMDRAVDRQSTLRWHVAPMAPVELFAAAYQHGPHCGGNGRALRFTFRAAGAYESKTASNPATVLSSW